MRNPRYIWQRGFIPDRRNDHGVQSGRWLHTDSEENYRRHGNKAYAVEDVSYELNSLGYRSKEFCEIDHTAFKILVAGCSETFGVGMPLHRTYGHQLATALRKAYDISTEVINLGMGSQSADYMARMLFQSVPILQPHYVFCLFPDRSRREYICKEKGHIVSEPFIANAFDESQCYEAMLTLSSDEWDFFSFVKNLCFIELVLRDYHWSWDTWSNYGREWMTCRKYLADYVDLAHYRRQTMPVEERGSARDNQHSGEPYHHYIADDLLNDLGLQHAIAEYLQTVVEANSAAIG